TISATEGLPLVGVLVGQFSDSVPQSKATSFVASINWGDGSSPTTTAGTITANGTTLFDVTGSHTFAEEGTFPVAVTVTDTGGSGTQVVAGVPITIIDAGGSTATIASTARVAEAPLSSQGATVRGV